MRKTAVALLLMLSILYGLYGCSKKSNPSGPGPADSTSTATLTATDQFTFSATSTHTPSFTSTCTETAVVFETETVTPSGTETISPTATQTMNPRTPPADGIYRMRIKHSNYYVDLEGGGMAEGTNIYQWEPNGSDNQRWIIEQVSPPYYRIMSIVSGNVADVAGVSYDNGANIHSWHWAGTDNQLWLLVDRYDGSWNIQSKLSGKNWDVQGAQTGSGANIYQWDAHAGDNQRFFLEASLNTPTLTATETHTATPTATMTATAICAVSLGTSNMSSPWPLYNDWIMASVYTVTADMTVTSLGMSQNNPDLFVIGIYTDAAGKPGTLICQTGINYDMEVTKERPVTPVMLYAGNSYWLVTTTENGQNYRAAGNNSLHTAYPWSSIAANSGLPADLSPYTWTSSAVVNTIYAVSCD
jgi:hypothetical protein